MRTFLLTLAALVAVGTGPARAVSAPPDMPKSADAVPTAEGRPVGDWIMDLQIGPPEQRRKALAVLAKFGPKAKNAIAPLVHALRDPDPEVRGLAADALGAIGPNAREAVPTLVLVMKDEKAGPFFLSKAAMAAGSIGGPENREVIRLLLLHNRLKFGDPLIHGGYLAKFPAQSVPHLIAHLKDEDAGVRARAAWVLGTLAQRHDAADPLLPKVGPTARDIGPALVLALDDSRPAVRLAAASALVLVEPRLADKVIPTVLAALRAKQVQAYSAAELLRPAAKAAVPALIRALDEPNDEIRFEVASALAYLGEAAVPPLAEALKAERVRVRSGAAVALGRMGKVSVGPALPALVAALKDSDAGARLDAAEALSHIDPEKAGLAVPVLAAALRAEKAPDRLRAAEALERLRGTARPAVPALLAALNDEDRPVRLAATLALIAIDREAAAASVPVLIDILQNGDTLARRRTARAAASLGPAAKGAVPELLRALKADDVHLRLAAAEAVARVDRSQAKAGIEVLAGLLADKKHRSSMVRAYALQALGRIGPDAKDALPVLAAVLDDDGPFHGEAAAVMLKIDPQNAAALDFLRKVLKGQAANDGLFEMFEDMPELGAAAKPLVPDLLSHLKAPAAFFRLNAARTLGAIGPDAREAVPLLRELAAKDKRADVREAAAEALKKIEPKAAP